MRCRLFKFVRWGCIITAVLCIAEICFWRKTISSVELVRMLDMPRSTLGNDIYNYTKVVNDPCNRNATTKSRRLSLNLTVPFWSELRRKYALLDTGGRFNHTNCSNPDRVAIIIPYRNRDAQLRVFLQNMHPFLQRQDIQYGIYIVEPASDVVFNRALLMNIGFVEASRLMNYQCFIFHDVDLLPEDDANLYTCPGLPRHMSVAVNTLNYTLPYPDMFGGVTALRKEHFHLINGYSNLYFGWGGEDDDMSERIMANGLSISRYSEEVARYTMINHTRDEHNEDNRHRFELLHRFQRFRHDGLTSIKYYLLGTMEEELYTKFLVHFDPKDYNVEDYILPEKTNTEVVIGMVVCLFAVFLLFIIYLQEQTFLYIVKSIKYELCGR